MNHEAPKAYMAQPNASDLRGTTLPAWLGHDAATPVPALLAPVANDPWRVAFLHPSPGIAKPEALDEGVTVRLPGQRTPGPPHGHLTRWPSPGEGRLFPSPACSMQ